MVLEKEATRKRAAVVVSTSRDNQLFQIAQEGTVSSTEVRPPSTDGSPEVKRARMVHTWGSSNATTVAKRLEDTRATLEEREANPTYTIESTVPEFKKKRELDDDDRFSLRLIAQHLRDLGLTESVATLVGETGICIEHKCAEKLRYLISAEDWDGAIDVLRRAALTYPPDQVPEALEKAREEIVLYKIMNCFDDNDCVSAFELIRAEMQRYPKNQEIKELSKLLFFSPHEMHSHCVMEQFRHYREEARLLRSVERILPDDFMLKERHLKRTFRKAKYSEKETPVENNVPNRTEYIQDKDCNTPSGRIHRAELLYGHTREVMALAFSPNGHYLATASSRNNIVVYEVNPKTYHLSVFRAFSRPPPVNRDFPVKNICWSYDSRFICVVADSKAFFDPFIIDLKRNEHRELKLYNTHHHTRGFPVEYTACTFVGQTLDLALADENGHFEVHSSSTRFSFPFDLTRVSVLASCPGFRIRQMASTSDGAIVALDSQNRIRVYEYLNGTRDKTIIQEQWLVVSFAIHKSERLIAVQTECNLHLWDIAYNSLVRTLANASPYSVIDCAFGGMMQKYIAVGAHNGKLKIFDLNSSFPKYEIEAHENSVTAIAWHPKIPHLLVSSGPDKKLVAWHFLCPKGVCKDEPSKAQRLVEIKKQIRKEHKLARRKRLALEAGVASAAFDSVEHDIETQHLVNGLTSVHLNSSPRKKKRSRNSKLLDFAIGPQDDSTQDHDSEFRSSESSSRAGSIALTVSSFL